MVTVHLNSYSFALSVLYVLLAIITLFQISRILYFRHSIFHYQFGFLVFNFVWSVLRFSFWLIVPIESDLIEFVLQGIALQIQFSTFTMLVLFYSQLIYKADGSWHHYQKRAFVIYTLVNLLFLCAFLGTVIVSAVNDELKQEADNVNAFIVSIMYLILSLAMAVFGWKLHKLVSTLTIKVPFLRSSAHITIVSFILVSVFISRAIKDFLTGLDIGSLDVPNDPSASDTLAVEISLFVMMFLWEIIPAATVIFLFWRIPDPRVVSKIPTTPHNHYSINNEAYSSDNSVWNNPGRYDSDEENPVVSKNPTAESGIEPVVVPVTVHTPLNRPKFVSGRNVYTGYSTESLFSKQKGHEDDDDDDDEYNRNNHDNGSNERT
eukprot:TRINITY_DN721_c7_g1_i1.p1 TRINITY_DN721_c7_g1~~TRINITY_DN721_c7_g1_i1.p1  ORF type:complete len:377 (-),score=23.79 TRINITY_DN721_c7_g1_i1:169-1299(-)